MENRALLIAVAFAGLLAVGLLVADAVTGVVQARRVRDDDDGDAIASSRLRDVVWAVAVTAMIAVLTAFSVDSVIRSGSNVHGSIRDVLLLLAAVWAGVFLVGLVGGVAALGRENPRYARIRRDLRDRASVAMDAEEQRSYAGRLERADRARVRRRPATALLRALGLAIVLVAAFVVVVGTSGAPSATVLALGGAILALAATIVGARAARVRARATDELLDAQRAEVVLLLERARIPRAQTTPGLARRVATALAILREHED